MKRMMLALLITASLSATGQIFTQNSADGSVTITPKGLKGSTNSGAGMNNLALGFNTLSSNMTGSLNTAIGNYSLFSNTYCSYLQVDETTLAVLESTKKGATHIGYFWVYYNPLTGRALFKYEKGRSAEFPEEILKNFHGYLQTDGYAGYIQLGKSQNVLHVACWAHARRKFEEALNSDKAVAEVAMALIQELYGIERQARQSQLTARQRKELRIEKSLPIYNLLGKFIAINLQKALPKSTIGKALKYSFNRWQELGNFMMDGNIEIDNNLVENAIRPVALGRKNWLFAGTHESAQRLSIMYTFMAECIKHNVNPEQWLSHVLEKIPSANIQELHLLLPENFGKGNGGA